MGLNICGKKIVFIGLACLLLLSCKSAEEEQEIPTESNLDSITSSAEVSPSDNPTRLDSSVYDFALTKPFPDFLSSTALQSEPSGEGLHHSARKPLKGEFKVDRNGSPSYSFLFDLPAAISDYPLKLGIHYSGSRQLGALRNGWSLIGYSEIRKCQATALNDGFNAPIRGGDHEDNRFCLDGEPLILVSGQLGEDGSEYVTQRKSAVRVKAFGSRQGGPGYFELKTGDGSTKVFGKNDNAVDLAITPADDRPNDAYIWKIDAIIDQSGNDIDYVYEGSYFPDFIYYRGKRENERSVRVYFEWEQGLSQWVQSDTDPSTVRETRRGISPLTSVGEDLTHQTVTRLKRVQIAVDYTNDIAFEEGYNYVFQYDDVGTANQRGLAPKAFLRHIYRCQEFITRPRDGRYECSDPITLDWQYDFKLPEENSCDSISGNGWEGGAPVFENDYKLSHPLDGEFGYGGGNYHSHVLADFNDDDQIDVAVMYTYADGGNSRLDAHIAYANGDGTYSGASNSYSEIIGPSGIINHRLAADLNNDGMAELIAANASSSGWNAYIATNLGGGQFATPVHFQLSDENFFKDTAFQQTTGDFNGDGNIDLMVFNHGNSSSDGRDRDTSIFNRVPGLVAYVALGRGDGTFEQGKGGQLLSISEEGNHFFHMRDRGLMTADFNGDGITDIGSLFLNRQENDFGSQFVGIQTVVAFGTPSGVFEEPVVQLRDTFPGYTGNHLTASYPSYAAADVNGDGYMDMVLNHERYGTVITSFIGRGDGTFETMNYVDANGERGATITPTCNSFGGMYFKAADYNGDGYADLLKGGGSFYLGRGDGTFVAQGGVVIYDNGDIVSPSGGGLNTEGIFFQDTTYGSYALDVNNDDKVDFMEVVVDRDGVRIGTVATAYKPGQARIRSIQEGGAKKYALTYASITDPEVYEITQIPELPQKVLRKGREVVKRVSIQEGKSQFYNKSYYYKDLLVDIHKKADLGFGEITVVDDRQRRNITSTTKYEQSFPMNGLEKKVSIRSGNGTLLSEIENYWNFEVGTYSSGGRDHAHYVIRNERRTESQYSTDGSFMYDMMTEFNDFNEFGQARSIYTEQSDGYTADITQQYKSVSNWDGYLAGLVQSRTEVRYGPDLGDTLSATKELDYYPSGLLRSIIQEPNDPDLYLKTELTYYEYGALESKTVSGSASAKYPIEPQTESYVYRFPAAASASEYYYEIEKTNAENHVSSELRSATYNHPVKTYDVNDIEVSYRYDTYGDLISITDQKARVTTTFTQMPCDESCPDTAIFRVLSQASGRPRAAKYVDFEGREVRLITEGLTGKLTIRDTQYDSYGRVIIETEPYYLGDAVVRATQKAYDDLGRPAQIITPGDGKASFEYRGLSGDGVRVIKKHIRSGSNGITTLVTTQEQNIEGKITQVIGADDELTRYQYNAQVNVARIIDAANNTIAIEYNALGNKISLDDPDSGFLEIGSDSLGRTRYQKDAEDRELTWDYDRLNRPTSKTSIEGVDRWIYDIALNGVGMVAQEVSRGGFEKTYSYDQYSRLDIVNHRWGNTSVDQTIQYDTFGRIKHIGYGNGLDAYYGYAASGRLQTVANFDAANSARPANAVTYWHAQSDFADGQIERAQLNSGTLEQWIERNPYSGRLGRARTEITGSTVLMDQGFAFDSVGNLEWRGDYQNNIAESFIYDELNRLHESYIGDELADVTLYDAIGNIEMKSDFASVYNYGENNAGPRAVTSVTTITGQNITYDYDDTGNMTSGGGRGVVYSVDQRPTRIAKGGAIIDFEYDANGQRVARREGGVVTYYIDPAWHNGNSFELQVRGSETIEKLYVAAKGLPIAMTERTLIANQPRTEHFFFHKDHLGSVVAIINQNNGLEESTNYKAFGAKRLINVAKEDDSPLISQRTTRGFTGHEHLDQVTLIHMNARLYDPELGRFISPDTVIPDVSNPQAINRYAYVYNNPLSLTDPSGNMPYGAGAFWAAGQTINHTSGPNAATAQTSMDKSRYDGVKHTASITASVEQNAVGAPGVSNDSLYSGPFKITGSTQENRNEAAAILEQAWFTKAGQMTVKRWQEAKAYKEYKGDYLNISLECSDCSNRGKYGYSGYTNPTDDGGFEVFIDLKLASSQWFKAELSGKRVSAGWDRTLIHEVYGHGFGNFDGEHYGHTKTVEMMNTIFRQMGSHYPAESTSPGYIAKRYQGAQSTIQSR